MNLLQDNNLQLTSEKILNQIPSSVPCSVPNISPTTIPHHNQNQVPVSQVPTNEEPSASGGNVQHDMPYALL